jgi:hypothetical protein
MFEKYNKEEEQEQKALFIEFVSKLLPTDKEIIAKARDGFDPYDSDRSMQDGLEHGFMEGASWVLEQIKNAC